MAQFATMPKAVQETGPTPDLFFSTISAYQRAAALKGAIDLAFFTAIGEGSRTAKDISVRCQASERGCRILADYLTIAGFLTKHGNQYGLTPESAAYLDKRSPAYMGSVTGFMNSPDLVNKFSDIAGVVRKGGTLTKEGGTVSTENPIWVDFARAMMPMNAMSSEALAKLMLAGSTRPMKILDIAGGHGLYGLAFAKQNPNADVTIQDWASVAAVAEENAKAAGVQDRFHVLAGSAFEVEFGSGFDVVLLTNFLHHFNPATNLALLKKIHAALAPNGRVATVEFVPNEDRISPPMPAAFSLVMLATTDEGDAYTYPEFEKMFNAAGFSRNDLHPLPKSPENVIISYK